MSSADSDGPLLFQRATLDRNKAARSDSDSPLPDWLSQHTSPGQPLEMLSDSDDAIGEVAEEGAHTHGSQMPALDDGGIVLSTGQTVEQQHAAEGRSTGKRKRKAARTVLPSSDDNGCPLPKARSWQGAAGKRQRIDARKAAPLEAVADQAAGPFNRLPTRGGPDPQQGASNFAEEPQLVEVGLSSQEVKGGKQTAAKGAAAMAARPGEIPIMLPDKLPHNKFIVELEADPYGSTDLTGDAGVVGRWLVESDPAKRQELQLDLKGVLYTVNVVPCASTLCLVTLGATEARVEALAGEYMALRRRDGGAPGEGCPAEDGRGDMFMFADDDDNYLVQGGTQQGGDEQAGPSVAKGKKKGKAGAGGAGKKPAAKRSASAKPAGGAKKKPSAKPAGKGMGGK